MKIRLITGGTVLGIATLLAACAQHARPQLFQGDYYMVGDTNCTQYRFVFPTRIECMTRENVATGYRDAMTPEQLQMYQIQASEQRAQRQELNQQIRQTGQMFQNAGQQALQQSQSYSTPVVPAYGQRPGVTYNRVGDTLIGTDGSSCQVVNDSVICN
jgi:hypothetical protein